MSCGSGSIGFDSFDAYQPSGQSSKCRCGPVEEPVLPTWANGWPAASDAALDRRDRALPEVHEDVVGAVGRAQDDVVTGAAGLHRDPVDERGDGRDHGRALRGRDVLALVDVAVALGAEAGVRAAERVGAGDREDDPASRPARRGGGTREREPAAARRLRGPAERVAGVVERAQRDVVVAGGELARRRRPRVACAARRVPLVAEPEPLGRRGRAPRGSARSARARCARRRRSGRRTSPACRPRASPGRRENSVATGREGWGTQRRTLRTGCPYDVPPAYEGAAVPPVSGRSASAEPGTASSSATAHARDGRRRMAGGVSARARTPASPARDRARHCAHAARDERRQRGRRAPCRGHRGRPAAVARRAARGPGAGGPRRRRGCAPSARATSPRAAGRTRRRRSPT